MTASNLSFLGFSDLVIRFIFFNPLRRMSNNTAATQTQVGARAIVHAMSLDTLFRHMHTLTMASNVRLTGVKEFKDLICVVLPFASRCHRARQPHKEHSACLQPGQAPRRHKRLTVLKHLRLVLVIHIDNQRHPGVHPKLFGLACGKRRL